MAHLIDMSNYRANMAHTERVTPWHGLGNALTVGAPLEVWAQQAGMSHSIERSRVVFRHTDGANGVGVMDDRHVLYRSDTRSPLAVVSDGFKIVQPLDVLNFFKSLVTATGDYEMETAGVLNEGRKYWALAKYREALKFGNENVLPYLLLATACDGSMNSIAQHTSVCVVCNNTLEMSLGNAGAGTVKVRHTSVFDGDAVRAQLNVGDNIAGYVADVEMLINKTLTRENSVEILVELVAKRDATGEITNEKSVKHIVNEIMLSLANAPGHGLETRIMTAWGTMNAVTHYVDFKARARSDNNRFNSGQFGAGAKLKRDAFNALQAA